MKNKIIELISGSLVRASSWLFVGGIFGGFLGYLFHIIMGRMLSVSDYGTFVSLMAILILFGSILNTLTMVVARKIATYRPVQYISQRSYMYYSINQKIFLILIIILLFLLLTLEPLQQFFLVEKKMHLYLMFGILFIAFPQSINNAFLQGMQCFKWVSASGVLSVTLKIIIAVALIYAGYGVSGALGGVLISSLIMLIVTYFALHPFLVRKSADSSKKTSYLYKAAIPVLLANFAFAIMTQIDMIMVKHYFSDQDAGVYAAASILGKAVMYLPASISLALFPMVAERHNEGKSTSNLLLQAVSITIILCTIGSCLYYYFSHSITLFLYGEGYEEAAEVLKYFGFSMFPMALIMVAEHFLIAMGRVLFAYLFMIVAPLQVMAFYFYHDTLLSIVFIMAVSGIFLVIVGYGMLWKVHRSEKNVA